METKKVYAALAQARLRISTSAVAKSGKTAPIKFKNGGAAPAREYLSLKDITPLVVEACENCNLVTAFEFTTETVTLRVISSEDGSELAFTIPANLQGSEINMGNGGGQMHPIQRLGSNITYLRRYMLVLAFEIVENDNIEGTEQIEVDDTPQLTPEQEAENLRVLAVKHFVSGAKDYIKTHPNFTVKQLGAMCGMKEDGTMEELNAAITVLESLSGSVATPEPELEPTEGPNYDNANF